MTTTAHTDGPLKTMMELWKEAQSPPLKHRIDAEVNIIDAFSRQPGYQGLSANDLQLLCERGNPDGYAFAHGLSVHWYPDFQSANFAWWGDYFDAQGNTSNHNALGPKPQKCTLHKALQWGRGFCQVHTSYDFYEMETPRVPTSPWPFKEPKYL